MKRPVLTVIALLALATVAVPTALVTASATSTPKVTGSVALTNPLQYASFNAFDQSPVKGSITYTNFTYASPGSGVWNLNSPVHIDFVIGGSPYDHTMVVDTVTAENTNAIQFTAHGSYDANPSYTWNATGTVTGSAISLNLVYTGLNPGYQLSLVGTIAADGSMSGTETGGSTGTWSSPAASAFEVLSYTAPVTCAIVDDTVTPGTATFGFTIPAGTPLAGTAVVVNVTDGGSPGAGNDTWAHGVDNAPGACTGSTTPYTITGGNLVVH